MFGARKKCARLAWAILGLIFAAYAPAFAGQARRAAHLGATYDVYAVEAPASLRLFWKDAGGRLYRSFGRVKAAVEEGGGELVFAMNAGMFHPDHRPVGLYIDGGVEMSPLVLRGGGGNFFMRPNGVFYVTPKGAGVMEAGRYARSGLRPRLATQSGPLLLEKGRMHPRFYRDSPYRKMRNGVGVRENGEVVFAVSRVPVNFYEFASFFRDALGCPDALFLDGSLSDAYIPALSRLWLGGDFGPIIGEVATKGGP